MKEQAGRDRRLPPTRFALLTVAAGLVVAVVVFVLVANNLGTDGSDGANDGSQPGPFVAGRASVLADAIRQDGPVLLPDPLGGGRDVYLQHLGGDQWRAFEARAPGGRARCVLRWQATDRVFVDPCTMARFPADGTGLVSFPTRVDDDGRVVVDVRRPIPLSSTTPPTTRAPTTSPPTTPPPTTG